MSNRVDGASPPEILVFLPVYNEEARLELLLERLRPALSPRPFRVVAVDDGSEDGSAALLHRRASELGIVVLTHDVNRGLAQTLYDGLRWIAENARDSDVAVTMDADDTHDPALVPLMMEKIEAGYDVVVASRFQSGSRTVGVPPHRRLYSAGVRVLLRLFLPIPNVRDFACGYRAIRVSVLRRAIQEFGDAFIELRRWGFICTAEVLWKLHLVGARCTEVPFVLRYDLKESPSRMRALRTIAGYALLVLQSRRGE